MKRIIVGYDGSAQAQRALERAAELGEALGARLLVVSVSRSPWLAEAVPVLTPVDLPVPATPPGPVVAGSPVPLPPDPRPEPKDLAEHQLERARMSLSRHRVDAEYVAEVGDAAERLLALSRERAADLIVVGSHERRFLDHLLGRHVDESIARHADCDVLLVH